MPRRRATPSARKQPKTKKVSRRYVKQEIGGDMFGLGTMGVSPDIGSMGMSPDIFSGGKKSKSMKIKKFKYF